MSKKNKRVTVNWVTNLLYSANQRVWV